MSNTKHTPGPWQVMMKDIVNADNSITVAVAHGPVGTQKEVGGEHEANARLIAAAPELLDALVSAHEAMDRLFARLVEAEEGFLPTQSGQPWEAMQKVYHTIAKATKP